MIPKRPKMPAFATPILDHIERAVFDFSAASVPPTCAFVFGGTHFGAWQKTIEADQQFNFKRIYVTGGNKRIGVKHHTWTFGEMPEAEIIRQKLIEGGTDPNKIEMENTSENTKDNIVNLVDKLRPYRQECFALIGRSYAMGRQARTFKSFCSDILTVPIVYDMEVNNVSGNLTRENWKEKDEWRSVVWGEYIRIIAYGRNGEVFVDFTPPESVYIEIEQYLE